MDIYGGAIYLTNHVQLFPYQEQIFPYQELESTVFLFH